MKYIDLPSSRKQVPNRSFLSCGEAGETPLVLGRMSEKAVQEICVRSNTLTCLDSTHSAYEHPKNYLKDMPGNFFFSAVSARKYAMKNRRPNTFDFGSRCVGFFIHRAYGEQATSMLVYMYICEIAAPLSAAGVQAFDTPTHTYQCLCIVYVLGF